MRILVVEDYKPIRDSIVQGLREANFAVDSASDGIVAMEQASQIEYDVIVLDLMLPKLDGMGVLRQLRLGKNRACVLVLSAKDLVADRVAGLRAGADDYLVKPFSFEELLARVETLLRRKYDTVNPLIEIKDLTLNTATQQVHRDGNLISLTAREYVLLEYLARRTGEIVSRDDIWEHVYDFPENSQSNVIDVYIGYLRKKIEREGKPKLIGTKRGRGYVLGLEE